MTEWKKVTFEVPLIATSSDEELEALHRFRDGRWSRTVKEAMADFGAAGLSLDGNWASCSPTWACPICRRPKSELFRLNAANILIANLHCHHDHLNGYVKDRLRERLGPEWSSAIPTDTHHLEDLSGPILERFEPSLICTDCNTADGKAKKSLGIPDAFSFRPSEIAQFIKLPATPHSAHKIDVDRASVLWSAAKDDFYERLAIADLLVKRVLSGSARERGYLGRYDEFEMTRYLNHWVYQTAEADYRLISEDLYTLSIRSIAGDGVGSSIKKRPRGEVKIPEDEEVELHDGGGAPELWAAAGSDWKCPICDRSKKEIMRRSKQRDRKWSGRIYRHTEYEIIYSETGNRSVYSHTELLICEDCFSIARALKQRKPDLSQEELILQVADIEENIEAFPHEPHKIDWDGIEKKARRNLEMQPALETYRLDYTNATGCRRDLRYYLKRFGGDENRAWAALLDEYQRRSQSSRDEAEKTVIFLLGEATRLAPEIEALLPNQL